MTEPTPLLEVTHLAVSYGAVAAVRDVSFAVREGSIVAVVGANGAGKSTALSAISGLVRPRAGTVRFAGGDITAAPSHKVVASGIVQVPEGRQMIAGLTVTENLQMGAYQRRDHAAVRADIEAMFARFPVLRDRRRLPAASLSGGEQQMLAIARALMARPRLLMLDEPSMGLAPMLVNEVFRILQSLREEGRTILLVEQNARKALAICDEAYVIENGRTTLSGPGPALLTDERVVAAYLGTGAPASEPRAPEARA